MPIDRAKIADNRAIWRSIPSEVKARAPGVVSRVRLNDCGLIAAIFERNGLFEIEGAERCPAFAKLDDAEDYAVQALVEQEHSF